MRQWLALRIHKALTVTVSEGVLRPPGAGLSLRHRDADGTELAVLGHGDSFTMFFGRKTITELVMSPRAARALLGYLLRWWVFGTWCGIKPRLWSWAFGVLLDTKITGSLRETY